ncbi:MAG TPA: acyl-CoA thioesterase [Gryllotalpicola sp.]
MSGSPETLTGSSDSSGALGVRLQLRWADTDAYGHVNNVTWVRYLEEARVRLFGLPDRPQEFAAGRPPVFSGLRPGCYTVTAAQRLEYVRELPYRGGQEVLVEGWVSRVGASSVDLSFRVTDDNGELCLLADTTQAVREVATTTSHRFDEAELALLRAHLAEPNIFRRDGGTSRWV